MNPYEIAQALMEATDEQFVEIFAYYYKMFCKDDFGETLTAQDVKTMDIDKVTTTIRTALGEIVDSEEICQSAWWKGAKNV